MGIRHWPGLPELLDGVDEAVSASFTEHLVQMWGEEKEARKHKWLKVLVVPGKSVSADDTADLLKNVKKKSRPKQLKRHLSHLLALIMVMIFWGRVQVLVLKRPFHSLVLLAQIYNNKNAAR